MALASLGGNYNNNGRHVTPLGGVKKPRLVFVSDGQAIYRANALATQAKPCALNEQTGLELAVLDHVEVTRLTN